MLKYLFDRSVTKNLGSDVWYPIPSWLRVYLRTMSPARQVLTYARLMKGRDLSKQVDNEVGCAESVTRVLAAVFPYCRIITGTASLEQFLVTSPHFKEIPGPVNGAIGVAATVVVNGVVTKRGHVGIADGAMLWNNRSKTGLWGLWYSIQAFVYLFGKQKGMRVRWFLPV